jgi:hypothetical protein
MTRSLDVHLVLKRDPKAPDKTPTSEEFEEAVDGALGVLDIAGTRFFGDVEFRKPSIATLMAELRMHEPGCSACDAYVAHARAALEMRRTS